MDSIYGSNFEEMLALTVLAAIAVSPVRPRKGLEPPAAKKMRKTTLPVPSTALTQIL